MMYLPTRTTGKLLTLLTALTILALSACGDDDGGSSNGPVDTTDQCANVTCAQPQPTCEGSEAVSYSTAGVCVEADGSCDFSSVETRVDCAASDQICQAGQCIEESEDLCANVVCTQLPPTCDGDVAVAQEAGVCAPETGTCESTGEQTRVDCAEAGKTCEDGVCVDAAGLCEAVLCEAPDATCEGDIAVTYTGDGACDEADGTCDFSSVEVRTDCAAIGQVCNGAICVEPHIDHCAGVTCDTPPEATCEGDTAVVYQRGGVCDPADGTCDYSGSATRIDCASTGQTCQDGACVAVSGEHTVNAGDLIITEIMANPDVVDDSAGEYFEVYNTTTRTLHLNGLRITDEGTDAFTVDSLTTAPITIGPNEYFVFGRNANYTTNGNIDIDFEWSSMTLANTSDSIIITRPGRASAPDILVTSVKYDASLGFPRVPTGASLQLGSENDLRTIDPSNGSLWCRSTEAIHPANIISDQGTPGAQNTRCNYPD